ncbi:MAG: hypothetical protein IPM02_26335, partial [Betaproteobacteria bacterium]|nr:hypothetical protein [Betaproteobacteria bacterium]
NGMTVRAMEGRRNTQFDNAPRWKDFFGHAWRISPDSNRMDTASRGRV